MVPDGVYEGGVLGREEVAGAEEGNPQADVGEGQGFEGALGDREDCVDDMD